MRLWDSETLRVFEESAVPQNHWLDGLVRTMSGHLASIIWLFKSPKPNLSSSTCVPSLNKWGVCFDDVPHRDPTICVRTCLLQGWEFQSPLHWREGRGQGICCWFLKILMDPQNWLFCLNFWSSIFWGMTLTHTMNGLRVWVVWCSKWRKAVRPCEEKNTARDTQEVIFTVSNRQSSHFSQAGKPLHYKASVYCAVDVRGIAVWKLPSERGSKVLEGVIVMDANTDHLCHLYPMVTTSIMYIISDFQQPSNIIQPSQPSKKIEQ